MVLARKDLRDAFVFRDYGKSSMSAHVVERSNNAFTISNHKERVSCLVETVPLAVLGKSQFVGYQQPVLGEDGSPLELVYVLGSVP